MDPYQVNFFISSLNVPKVKRKSPTGVDQLAEELEDLSVEQNAETINVPIDPSTPHNMCQYHTKREEFSLAEGLLNLTKSPDQKIAVKACEGLMLLVGLPEARAARFLVECTSLGAIVCSKLNSLIKNLPMNVDPADVEATEAKWGLDPYSAKEDKTGFVGKRNLKSFLSYLDFVDTLLEESHRLVATAIAKTIREHGELSVSRSNYRFSRVKYLFLVFENELNKLLLATNENTSLSITAIVSKMISECKSQFLIKEISVFLLGSETKDPEIKGEKEIFSKLYDFCIFGYYSYEL